MVREMHLAVLRPPGHRCPRAPAPGSEACGEQKYGAKSGQSVSTDSDDERTTRGMRELYCSLAGKKRENPNSAVRPPPNVTRVTLHCRCSDSGKHLLLGEGWRIPRHGSRIRGSTRHGPEKRLIMVSPFDRWHSGACGVVRPCRERAPRSGCLRAVNAEAPAARANRAVPHRCSASFRYFSIASFVCIVIAATRSPRISGYVSIREIRGDRRIEQRRARRGGVDLGEERSTPVLDKADQAGPGSLPELPLPPALAHEIDAVMHVRSVARIKIYDDRGWVVHATRRASIGPIRRAIRA